MVRADVVLPFCMHHIVLNAARHGRTFGWCGHCDGVNMAKAEHGCAQEGLSDCRLALHLSHLDVAGCTSEYAARNIS